MGIYYILDEHGNPVFEPDVLKWATWFENSLEQRIVGNTMFTHNGEEIQVSTVFLSLPHPSTQLGESDTMLYETMVFGPDAIIRQLKERSESETRSIFGQIFGWNDIQKRYRTRIEAERGHAAMTAFVETCLLQMKLDTAVG